MKLLQLMNRSNAPRLGYYGKLPIHPDFLKFTYNTEVERDISQWIDKTATYEGGNHCTGKPIVKRGWTIRYMIPCRKEKKIVVGLIWDSADRGGERRYPFCLYVVLTDHKGKSWWRYLPVQMEWIWDRLDQLRWDIQSLESTDDLERYCRKQSMEIMPGRDQASNININKFNAVTIGSFKSVLYGEKAYSLWLNLWWQLKNRVDNGEYSEGYAFPLARSLGTALQISLWTGIMTRENPTAEEIPNVLMPGGSTNRLFLFYRSLKPSDGHELISNDSELIDNDHELTNAKDLELGDRFQEFAAAFLKKYDDNESLRSLLNIEL